MVNLNTYEIVDAIIVINDTTAPMDYKSSLKSIGAAHCESGYKKHGKCPLIREQNCNLIERCSETILLRVRDGHQCIMLSHSCIERFASDNIRINLVLCMPRPIAPEKHCSIYLDPYHWAEDGTVHMPLPQVLTCPVVLEQC